VYVYWFVAIKDQEVVIVTIGNNHYNGIDHHAKLSLTPTIYRFSDSSQKKIFAQVNITLINHYMVPTSAQMDWRYSFTILRIMVHQMMGTKTPAYCTMLKPYK